MSNIRPLQFLFYSIASGLLWASVVSLIGYLIGRFLDLKTSAFEENIIFIVLGFATFGMLLGYTIKRITYREMDIPDDDEKKIN